MPQHAHLVALTSEPHADVALSHLDGGIKMFIHHFINDARLCMSPLHANIQLNALRVARPQVSVLATEGERHSCDTVSRMWDTETLV
jgi:hypothetical protein